MEVLTKSLEFMNHDDNMKCQMEINNSRASDEIRLTRKSDLMLIDLWTDSTNTTESVPIPSDIFFAGTVPLLDCFIIIDERGYNDSSMQAPGLLCRFRVVISEEYRSIVSLAIASKKDQSIGYVIRYEGEIQIISPIYIRAGLDYLGAPGVIGYKNMPDEYKLFLQETYTYDAFHTSAISPILVTWYGIQVALLHPNTKSIFEKPGRTKIKASIASGKSNKKSKVKYIKTHVIKSKELEWLIYGDNLDEGRKIKRKALAWYVIGHWRKLKSGNMIFVKPHYKGVMRDVKTAVELRGREIAQVHNGTTIEMLRGNKNN